jgi:ribosome-interacting GTPase 1
LETVGLRLNKTEPDVVIEKKPSGGVKFSHTVPLTKLGPDPGKTIYSILHEYKMHNAHVVVRQDVSVDEFIDVIEGNRKYIRCLYVYNKVLHQGCCFADPPEDMCRRVFLDPGWEGCETRG